MRMRIAIFLVLAVSTHVYAQGGGTALDAALPDNADGILQSIENANVTQAGKELVVLPKDARTPIEMVFTSCQGLGVQYEANRELWILPLDAASKDHSWNLVLHGGSL